tara:strand:- start:6752 stop:7759 length:1008 start_codon:yes stop_codon:yes gene_type:complete
MDNNRVIRNNQGMAVGVMETPTGSPRTPRRNIRNPGTPPPMSPQQPERQRQRVGRNSSITTARRLNFSGAEYTKEDFYNEVKRALIMYPDHGVNNVRNLANYQVRHILNRNLTQQELEWLGEGKTRKITKENVNASKRKANIHALMAEFGTVSPVKKPKNKGITYYDDTFNVRSPHKVRNKVFLMTEINKNGKVTRVYNRNSLNKLNKKVGPFTQIPFENHHIKNYRNKNKIEKEFQNFKNLGFNVKNVIDAYIKNHMRPMNTFTPSQKNTIKKIMQTLKRNEISRNIKTLLKQKLALMITRPTIYETLGLSQVVYTRNLSRLINTIPKNIRNLF